MSRISRSRWTATENPARVDADRSFKSGLEPTERYDGLHPACHPRRCATASGSRRGPYSQQMLKEFGWITEARGGASRLLETVDGRCGGVDDEVVAKLVQLAGEVDGVETEAGRVHSDDRRGRLRPWRPPSRA